MPQFTVTDFVGTRNFGPINIPQGISQATFSLDAALMTDPAMQGSLQMDLSLDSGATWAFSSRGPETDPFPVKMEFVGGALDKHNLPIPEYLISLTIPHPELATRQLRSQLIVSGAPLTTTATLTAQ
jgi:hypothetical protein